MYSSSKSSEKSSDLECFNTFLRDPTVFSEGILQGTHKYLVDSLNGDQDGPTVDELFDIFEVFSRATIKKYVFKRIQKKLNLELAIAIVQDLLSNGEGRAETLLLEVEHLSGNGKKVVIADQFTAAGEVPLSQKDFPFIDEAIFRLSQSKESGGDQKSIPIGGKHGSPLKKDEIETGYYTPKGQKISERQKRLEVGNSATTL